MKRRYAFLVVAALAVVALVSIGLTLPHAAVAGGATQISGLGSVPGASECTNVPSGYDFATLLQGDLEGCLYTHVQSSWCSPSGTYHEAGNEIFVGVNSGDTFETTYFFQAKYQDCPNLQNEIVGRCQHPIVDGSGTGDFAGVSGRLHFKDDVVAGNFPYQGHLRY